MNHLLDVIRSDLFNPKTLIGAVVWGVVFFCITTLMVVFIRRSARQIESRLSDITGIRFASAFAQVLSYLIGFILYAHLVPDLRAVGTALLAGASVISIVFGLAAQNTLGNLISGISLVLYRPIRVGDTIQVNSPQGLANMVATVELVTLGHTILRDTEQHEVIVPNSVMVNSVVIRLERKTPPSDSIVG
ncbi:MAG: mechanosensitive ion channel family protein [Anaerolineales bacterium]|nr:mechanosensitive ion channel family protein [Anaerolineales bacterium]